MGVVSELFLGQGVAHSVLVISLVVALGIVLGRVRVGGISLGISSILFVGIVFSHFGMSLNSEVLHFLREFGLILFVYAVGTLVGPHFLESFKRGGLKFNFLAVCFVLMGIVITVALHFVTGTPMSTMVGVMSGAVTNTPGLGAAQQAYFDITGVSSSDMGLSYAVAYIVGVLGMILGFVVIRKVFRINPEEENDALHSKFLEANAMERLSFVVDEPSMYGLTVDDLRMDGGELFKIVGICRDGELIFASYDSVIRKGDRLLVEVLNKDVPTVEGFIQGKLVADDSTWELYDEQFKSRPLVVSNSRLNGKKLGDVKLERRFGVNIVSVRRDGVDLVAHEEFVLRVGDVVVVKGSPEAIGFVVETLGNNYGHLKEPNLVYIFSVIAVGVFLGSIPFALPGVPQPVKLGLAGGPLIVAILMSCFGVRFRLVTYSTKSSNLLLRDMGIAIFLACVGLNSGADFVSTVFFKGGYVWLFYAAFITLIPVLVVGAVGRKLFKLNYFTIMGVIAGSSTNPMALAYANSEIKNNAPSIGYATVYPLAMFLRVFGAQLLIIFFTV